jgi:hypothetical protein
MHSVTFTYPEKPTQDDKDRVKAFFAIMPFFLPCSVCGMHFVKEQTDMPLTEEVLSSMDTLSHWLVDVHNSVNRRLKKPELSYETIKKFYFEDATDDPRKYPVKKDVIVYPADNSVYKKACGFMFVLFLILGIAFVAMVVVPKLKNRQIISNND